MARPKYRYSTYHTLDRVFWIARLVERSPGLDVETPVDQMMAKIDSDGVGTGSILKARELSLDEGDTTTLEED